MKLIRTILIIFVFCMMCGCASSKSNVYSSMPEGYTEITSIPGVSFGMPLYVTNSATAVTQIQDGMEYDSNNIYTFNNGKDTYILFCMDQIIVMAQKGTQFTFSSYENKEQSLKEHSLFNTWFVPADKKLQIAEDNKSEIYKIISTVSAEVVITNELYGDYLGKLAVIENNQEEWSLFVGVISENTKELSEQQLTMIDAITQTMKIHNRIEDEKTYDVVIDTSFEPVENLSELTESTLTQYPASIDTSTGKTGFNISNQKKRELDVTKAYTSDIYSMLSLGQSGIFSCIGYEEQFIVRPTKVYRETAAIQKIKKYANTQDVYDYFEAKEGYHWELVEYDISCQNDIGADNFPYINVKILGLDGNPLIYRGIKLDTRTHDANSETTKDGNIIYNCYCYYAVPNGCKEYVLSWGDLINQENFFTAFYHIL